MPQVGRAYYSKIEGLPDCAHARCPRKAHRKGVTVGSRFCREHHHDEVSRLLATGKPWHEVRQQLWDERPRIRLTFVP